MFSDGLKQPLRKGLSTPRVFETNKLRTAGVEHAYHCCWVYYLLQIIELGEELIYNSGCINALKKHFTLSSFPNFADIKPVTWL